MALNHCLLRKSKIIRKYILQCFILGLKCYVGPKVLDAINKKNAGTRAQAIKKNLIKTPFPCMSTIENRILPRKDNAVFAVLIAAQLL